MPDTRVTDLAAIDAVAGSDLVMVIDDPGGTAVNKKATVTQVLVNVARTDVSNTFTGDQTVDGDLFVTGEVNPTVLLTQLPKINALAAGEVGDPIGSRTLMSKSFVSGLSVRHVEELALGKVQVGNYDLQTYQPLVFEVKELRVATGLAPATSGEHLRVHPSGGVTLGTVHTTDPGVGVLVAGGLGATPLNATQLLSGTVPDARLSGNVVLTNDARLTNARTPTAHATSHQPGGGDALAVDAAAATGSLRTLSTTATSACAGNDSRLTNARTPTAHASTHKTGQADVIKLDELGAPTDVTTLNASTSAHGLLPKLSNVATQYLTGVGTWAVPAGGGDVVGPGSSTAQAVATWSGTTGKALQDSTLPVGQVARLDTSQTFAGAQNYNGAVTCNSTLTAKSQVTISSLTGAPGFNLVESQAAANSRNWQMYSWNGTMQWVPMTDAWAAQNAGFGFNRSGALALPATGMYYELGRTIPMGGWQDIPFNAANFSAGGGGTWTVDAAAVQVNRYCLIGRTLHWRFYVAWFVGVSTLAGVVNELRFANPPGITFSPSSLCRVSLTVDSGGTPETNAGGGATYMGITKFGSAVFPAGAVGVIGTVTFEIG